MEPDGTGVVETGPQTSALDAAIAAYRTCAGNMQATADKLGWRLHELESVMDAVYMRMAEKAQTEDGRAVMQGRAIMQTDAIVEFAMLKMRDSERSGHRWGQVGVLASKHRSELGDLNMAQDTSNIPPTVVIVGNIPDAMPIRAIGDGHFEKVIEAVEASD